MKSLFWISQTVLFCSILYYTPLLSPVISHSWSMEEWSKESRTDHRQGDAQFEGKPGVTLIELV
jgi:hypothetical protein